MPHTLRTLVESRADGRCEYCRRYQDPIGAIFFEVEHIVPIIVAAFMVDQDHYLRRGRPTGSQPQ